VENPDQTQTPLIQENILTHSNKNSSLPTLLSGVALVTALVAGSIGYYLGSMQKTQTVLPEQQVQVTTKPESSQVACTMEAKLCPDGSSVGRSGPNCEFAPCPDSKTDKEVSADTKTYTNTGFNYAFSYPSNWKVTDEATSLDAASDSKVVLIFNPLDNPKGFSYTGMRIEFVGTFQDTMHGENYYVNIPDTDQYLYITGAGGYTANEETNQQLKQIFASFKFTR
jgi:hypothetical protein